VAADALLGYSAMRAVLGAISAAGAHAGDRAAVRRAALGPVPPRPLLGDRFAAYRRSGGRLRFLGLRSP
jgi:hypothetical protein